MPKLNIMINTKKNWPITTNLKFKTAIQISKFKLTQILRKQK